ncbi:uncharacterized protein BCR38DRAFT_420623 [Pseudomassariella vexata]|uniref:Uncharacterized protein n=1 Tax=Pseudomassariella vexata TaxID=1141098 RepID=A0A1Y2EEH3_9PEZI|nr:uncharacterized protein BCR38DRAFT_420623 [Pseudomassariella vexata]ORY69983.1 hypothetical protein BCR38DRAFT_420623 [Pseudomassariella vexata]
MCYNATCPTCSKQSWRGCGSHIPSALSDYTEDQWCICKPQTMVNGKAYPPAAKLQIWGMSWLSNYLSHGSRQQDGIKGEL